MHHFSGSRAATSTQFVAFDPERCGTPAEWNAHAAYITWNKRSAVQFRPSEVPQSVNERLAPLFACLSLRSDSQGKSLGTLVSPLSNMTFSGFDSNGFLLAPMLLLQYWRRRDGSVLGTGRNLKLFTPNAFLVDCLPTAIGRQASASFRVRQVSTYTKMHCQKVQCIHQVCPVRCLIPLSRSQIGGTHPQGLQGGCPSVN